MPSDSFTMSELIPFIADRLRDGKSNEEILSEWAEYMRNKWTASQTPEIHSGSLFADFGKL